jgi:hypothetical protein
VASLVATAKLNGVEPQAWLTDVLERVVSGRTKAHELERLLPWAWKAEQLAAAVTNLPGYTRTQDGYVSYVTSRV